MDDETKDLVDRWIRTFCEAPVLIDPELMRRVLADWEDKLERSNHDRKIPQARRHG
ncbi:hypothetical protein [Brevundimonas sp.]|uniref:hypothetical protein n=1 Tax=Brevundimonas sp. TaxID=1871086 RepID=UPI002AB86779|nr:hypothetical protein [Brevundimonas sp.]MDZ4363139.1 hypothetical protein [Brevundimonas sp.]